MRYKPGDRVYYFRTGKAARPVGIYTILEYSGIHGGYRIVEDGGLMFEKHIKPLDFKPINKIRKHELKSWG